LRLFQKNHPFLFAVFCLGCKITKISGINEQKKQNGTE